MPNPITETDVVSDEKAVVHSERLYMPIVISISTDRFSRFSYWITRDDADIYSVRCYREYCSHSLAPVEYHFINRQWSVGTLGDLASTLFHMTPVMVAEDTPQGQTTTQAYGSSVAISVHFSFGVEGMAMDGTNLYSDVSEMGIDSYLDPLRTMIPLLGCIMYNTEPEFQTTTAPLLVRT
jgi:hypothetical protein